MANELVKVVTLVTFARILNIDTICRLKFDSVADRDVILVSEDKMELREIFIETATLLNGVGNPLNIVARPLEESPSQPHSLLLGLAGFLMDFS